MPQFVAARSRCFGGKFSRAATATGATIGILIIVDLLEDEIAGGTDDRRFGTHACFERRAANANATATTTASSSTCQRCRCRRRAIGMRTTELLTAQLRFPLQPRAATRRCGDRCGAGMRRRYRCRCRRVITIDVLDIVVIERMLHTVRATAAVGVIARDIVVATAAIVDMAHSMHTVIVNIIVVIIAKTIAIAAVAIE